MNYYRIKTPDGYLAWNGFIAMMPWFPSLTKDDYTGFYTTEFKQWNDKLNAPVTDFPGLAVAFKKKDEEVMTRVRSFCPEAVWKKVVHSKSKTVVGKRTGRRRKVAIVEPSWNGAEAPILEGAVS